MRYCNGCGEKIRNENIFCPHCGFKQIKTAAETGDSTNVEEAEKIKEDSIPKIEEDPIVKSEIKTNVQDESSKTVGIILVGILIFIGAVYFSTSKSKNNMNLISTIDSVAVDSTIAEIEIPTPMGNSNDSLLELNSEDSSVIETKSNDSSIDDIAKQRLDEFSNAIKQDDYQKLNKIFGSEVTFHKLSNATIPQIINEIKNYKKRWEIIDENYISINLWISTRYQNLYKYEKTLQLKRIPDNGKLYKYHITGEMLIDNEVGTIVSLVDQKTVKEN